MRNDAHGWVNVCIGFGLLWLTFRLVAIGENNSRHTAEMSGYLKEIYEKLERV